MLADANPEDAHFLETPTPEWFFKLYKRAHSCSDWKTQIEGIVTAHLPKAVIIF